MTWIIDTKSKRRLSAKLAAGLAISAMLAVGTFAGCAVRARGGDGDIQQWVLPQLERRVLRAPPVVYGSPYGSSYYGSPTIIPRRWFTPASASACRALASAFSKLHANPKWQRPASLPVVSHRPSGRVHRSTVHCDCQRSPNRRHTLRAEATELLPIVPAARRHTHTRYSRKSRISVSLSTAISWA